MMERVKNAATGAQRAISIHELCVALGERLCHHRGHSADPEGVPKRRGRAAGSRSCCRERERGMLIALGYALG
jgi:hypothetical protein